MEKFSAQPPLLAGYADSTPQKFVRNVCVLHVGRKFWEKHHDLCKNLSLNCPNSSLPSGERVAPRSASPTGRSIKKKRRVRVKDAGHHGPHPALFLRLRPVGLALRATVLLPKGEGPASGFSLI